jgi:hypothetical protein
MNSVGIAILRGLKAAQILSLSRPKEKESDVVSALVYALSQILSCFETSNGQLWMFPKQKSGP